MEEKDNSQNFKLQTNRVRVTNKTKKAQKKQDKVSKQNKWPENWLGYTSAKME
mgnify:CR=1 FL=1